MGLYSDGLKYTSKALRYDADSVAAWTEQNRLDGEKSLVHYVKVQDTEDKGMGLTDDNFVLIIMSEAHDC